MTIEQGTRIRLATLSIFFAVFGAGLVMGFALNDRMPATADAAEATEETDPDPDGKRRSYVIDQVNMSPDQRLTVDSIVEEYQQQVKNLHREFVRPRYQSIIDTTRASLKSVLTQEQEITYDSLLAERNRARRERRERREDQESREQRDGEDGQSEAHPIPDLF